MRRIGGGLLLALALTIVVIGAQPAAGDGNEGPNGATPFRSITAGGQFNCGVLDNGHLKCWGRNQNGRLGQGTTTDLGNDANEMGDNLPDVNLGTGRTASAVAAGNDHACAILDTGDVKCWGSGAFGQLGYEDNATRGDGPNEMGDLLPTVNLGAHKATAIAASIWSTCAILDNGHLRCWGDNSSGKLGLGDTNDRGDNAVEMAALPDVNLGTGRTATAVAMGNNHTCAILDNGRVKCWGSSNAIGLGGGTTYGDNPGEMGDNLPYVDLGTSSRAIAISSTSTHTCALLDDHTVKCWGGNSTGQLGVGDTSSRGDAPGQMGDNLAPVNLGTGRTVLSIAAGGGRTCAVLDDHTAKCWGDAFSGLGYGNTNNLGDGAGEMGNALGVIDLGSSFNAETITIGDTHFCALDEFGNVKCWGNGAGGALGTGATVSLGDTPGEMGDNLNYLDLGTGRSVGPELGMTVAVNADETSVVAGQVIHYHVVITNTGGVRFTGIDLATPEVPACDQPVSPISPGAATTINCSYTTTGGDVPSMANVAVVTTDQDTFVISNVRRTRVDAVTIRPDAQIRLGAGAFIGNDVYNATGASQTRSTTVPNLGTATFTVRVGNDGNVSDDLTVLGQPTTSRYTVTYKAGPTNITSQVVAGTYTIDDLAPAATSDITVTIKAKAGTPVNNLVNRLITVTSATDTAQKDTVKASVKRR